MVKVIDLNQSVPIVTVRNKRSEDSTLEEATKKGNYHYWLSQEDIADIARIEYKNYYVEASYYAIAEFEIIGSLDQLQHQLEKFWFRSKALTTHRLTLIINLSNQHWVTLIVSKTNFAVDALYVDSQGAGLSNQYYRLLLSFGITINEFSIVQQTDDYNCGLWALENAADLNQMLEEGKPYEWISKQLSRPRNNDYFRERRQRLSLKLEADITRSRRLLRLPHRRDPLEANGENPKRMKVESKQEKLRILLNTYVEAFMSSFVKRLAAYHLAAKGERLTLEALLTELKTGSTAALMGALIAQSIIGTIPSLVTSLRSLGSRYYLPKNKARKITRIFSNVQPGDLSQILAETGVEIFQSFESQFMHVSDKAGDKVAMEKLAEDAAGRALNYIVESTDSSFISKALILNAILLGKSEKFFDPSFKNLRVRVTGSLLQDKQGNKLTTAQLYKKVGLVEVSSQNVAYKFYREITSDADSIKYGYRRLLSIEKNENGKLKEVLKKIYQHETRPTEETVFQRSLKDYVYILQFNTYQQEAERILNKIKDRYSITALTENLPPIKKNIVFDLKRPVENFTGRTEVLATLHRILMSGRTMAVVTAFSELSVSEDQSTGRSLANGGQVSVSGLGGIGKTQLALRYAELYAADYDNNVVWINSETDRDLAYSFDETRRALRKQCAVEEPAIGVR